MVVGSILNYIKIINGKRLWNGESIHILRNGVPFFFNRLFDYSKLAEGNDFVFAYVHRLEDCVAHKTPVRSLSIENVTFNCLIDSSIPVVGDTAFNYLFAVRRVLQGIPNDRKRICNPKKLKK
jgi:hypothetical protein